MNLRMSQSVGPCSFRQCFRIVRTSGPEHRWSGSWLARSASKLACAPRVKEERGSEPPIGWFKLWELLVLASCLGFSGEIYPPARPG